MVAKYVNILMNNISDVIEEDIGVVSPYSYQASFFNLKPPFVSFRLILFDKNFSIMIKLPLILRKNTKARSGGLSLSLQLEPTIWDLLVALWYFLLLYF
jgi:hypothetical protein